jgi:hypothetical protein
VIDVIDGQRKGPLIDRGDAASHLLSRKPRIAPVDTYHGNIDVGEDILRRAKDRKHAQDQDDDGRHHKGIRSS